MTNLTARSPLIRNRHMNLNSILLATIFISCNNIALKPPNEIIYRNQNPIQIELDLQKLYDEYNVKGSFVMNSLRDSQVSVYNPALITKAISPASTFNIMLALIALEEGVLVSTSDSLKPDGMTQYHPPADTSISLETAFKYNRDWFFIRLASLIGNKKFDKWMREANMVIIWFKAKTTGSGSMEN